MLDLPLVRFAPFMAVGMLTAYFGGGLFCGIVFAAAAAVVVYFAVKRSRAVICAAGLLWGIVVMSLHLELYCKPITAFGGSTVQAELVVNEVTMQTGGSRSYIVEMNLSGRKAKVEIENDRSRLEVGDIASAIVELNMPDSDNMPQNLADGVLLSGEIAELMGVTTDDTGIYAFIRGLRSRMIEKISGNIFGSGGELSLAMLLGEDSALSPVLREKLKICGAAHYTAVSGSHFAMFAAVLLGILPEKRKNAKQIISLMFAPAAVVFFGPTPSVLRASVMFMLHSLAPIFYRKADTLNSLCIAIALICTFSPGTILDTGFIMSVLGVFGAGVVGTEVSKKLSTLLPDKAKKLSPAVTAVTASVCAVICTSPVSVFVFKGVSMLGALVSLILMPLMTVSVMFAVPLGLTGFSLLAVPVDLAMRAAAAVIGFFGSLRGAWLTLDFKTAWIFAAVCAVLAAVAAFGDMKVLAFSGKCMLVPIALSLMISRWVLCDRSEVRFVGNYSTGAAVVFEDNEALVFISGSGKGLAAAISRTMREHGAQRIACLAAFDADYGGALMIRELSEMTDIGTVYSNTLVHDLLGEMNVYAVADGAKLSISGVTLAAAKPSDKETAADIVMYSGRLSKETESPARYAIYFSGTAKDMPENWYNARLDRDFRIPLEKGTKFVSVIQK